MNSTLTKAEAIKVIASQTDQKPQAVAKMLDTLFKTIYHNLASGRRVELRGFGVWEIKMSKQRVGRNPNHPERGPVIIPAKPVVRFRLGKELKSISLTPTPVS